MVRRRRFATGLSVASLLAASLLTGAVATSSAQSGPSPAATRAVDDDVHLNQTQVIGSHNSYHELLTPKENEIRQAFLGDANQDLTYRHVPLPEQFANQKVRQIELDVWLDSAGGKYADPLIREVAGEGPYDPAMNQPGIKVFHVQDVDYHSSCLSLVACLKQIKGWSDANPSHVPIAILLELKDDPLQVGDLPIVKPTPWNKAGEDSLDAEIRSVMGPDDLITPDDIRGSRATLSEAVTTDGWPTLAESRGKFLFLMDNGGAKRTDYLVGHPALQGRVLFTNADPGDPDAAFVERNNSSDASIPGIVKAGYVVRTRADANTREARSGDTSVRDKALASGAQWVSTDYPVPGLAVGFTSDYFAEIPGGTVARCNPVNAPASCVSSELDRIFTAVPPPTDPFSTTTTQPGDTTSTTVIDGGAGPLPPGVALPPPLPATAQPDSPLYTG